MDEAFIGHGMTGDVVDVEGQLQAESLPQSQDCSGAVKKVNADQMAQDRKLTLRGRLGRVQCIIMRCIFVRRIGLRE